jgi:hypothetical protein
MGQVLDMFDPQPSSTELPTTKQNCYFFSISMPFSQDKIIELSFFFTTTKCARSTLLTL